ncbi:diguanylate cyclase, partial [Escherichia coli]|uniref:diguanylate cyclase domain-containing protein n=1 Tax=Escherichia coli TaxID=562 RepID=UPI002A81CA82
RMYKVLENVRREVFLSHDGREFSIAFSAGVAEFPRHGMDLDSLYRAADEALYRAKEAGRGRVFAAENDSALLAA